MILSYSAAWTRIPRRAGWAGVIWFFTSIGLLTACDRPQDALEARGLEFDAASFIKSAGDGDDEAVSLFLRGGIAVDLRDAAGTSALMAASADDRRAIMRRLLEAGADPNAQSSQGSNALHLAASRGHAQAVQVLLAAGADRDVRDRSTGMNALAVAAFQGHVEVVRRLLQAGADSQAVDAAGITPRDYARSQGHAAVVGLLPPPWLPAGWTLHEPFDERSPYWPDLTVWSTTRGPPTQRRILLRSPVELESQVFLMLGPLPDWADVFATKAAALRDHPLLRRHDSARIAMRDGRVITIERFDLDRGLIAGRKLSQAIGMVTVEGQALVVEAGSGAEVDLLLALREILSRFDGGELRP